MNWIGQKLELQIIIITAQFDNKGYKKNLIVGPPKDRHPIIPGKFEILSPANHIC
jgi:hypothetical protein